MRRFLRRLFRSIEPRDRAIDDNTGRPACRRLDRHPVSVLPNKHSLLFAALDHHMNNVAERIEAACESACHKPLAEMIKGMVEAFVDAKMERAEIP